MVRSNVIPTISCCIVNTNGGTAYLVSNTLDDAMETTPSKYHRRTATGTGILYDLEGASLVLSLAAEAEAEAVTAEDDATYDGSSMPP